MAESKTTMRRIIVKAAGGTDAAELQLDASVPEDVGSKQVRVRLEYAGVTQPDVQMRSGTYKGGQPPFPLTPGYGGIGIVDKVGDSVPEAEYGYKTGSRVAVLSTIGCWAEYIVVPRDQVFPVPDNIDGPKATTLILNYITAYQMLTRTIKLQKGETILVHGASGGVGTALVELAVMMGLEVYGTCSASKVDVVTKLGAKAIDYRAEKFENVVKKLPGGGVDAVFDSLGGDHFLRSYSCLRKGGRFVAYRSSQTSIASSAVAIARIKMSLFDGRGAAEIYKINDVRKDHLDWFREDLSTLCDWVMQGKVNPIIAGIFPLERVHEATKQIEDGKIIGMSVLKISSSQS